MEPFKHWQDWQKNVESFLGENFFSNFGNVLRYSSFPLVNIYKTDQEILLLASIPGLDNINNVDVYIDYQSIELKGDIHLRYRGFTLSQNELFTGHFERKIDLPFPVKEDKIDAIYQNGLLIIHLYRLIPEHVHRQKIPIKKIGE